MSSPVISVESLSKSYRLGQIGGGTIREDFSRWWARLRGRPDPTLKIGQEEHARQQGQEFWALQDVGFEVQQGEILGIIGRNGAGKSTLLKILSRVTAPTSGEVRVKGRIASLLEVGTGFHPELTGRENIFLNGAILGMSKAEIRKKFDEIVAFSGVEEFIDTPVKRYSSGMYVRLAFAVAAHLEPEILIVDEVLAVGDAQFQKKCIRKMEGIAGEGRTVLVVSHNLSTVQTLSSRVVRIHMGAMVGDGAPREQVRLYMKEFCDATDLDIGARTDREGSGEVRLTEIAIIDIFGNRFPVILAGDSMEIQLKYESRISSRQATAAVSVWTIDGTKVFHIDNRMRGHSLPPLRSHGTYVCKIPRVNLTPGRYYVNLLIAVDDVVADHVEHVAEFDVRCGDYFRIGQPTPANGGLILVDHEWS